MDISKIDPNFALNTNVDADGLIWRDAAEDPFVTYGAVSKTPWLRLPLEVARTVSAGVLELAKNTAGVRLRFRTDSPFIAIRCHWDQQYRLSNMTTAGVSGFDLYSVSHDHSQHLIGPVFIPPVMADHGYASIARVKGEMTDYVLNFPLYNGVGKLYIGVHEKARFETPARYANQLPVVFYGSSITQGGCATRPGNSYQGFLSRMLDMDYVNLGFSGCGKAEDTMVAYLKDLPMSVFVSDYDYNAPNPEYLRGTHYKMYRAIRDNNPNLPYVMISKPNHYGSPSDYERREVIMESYLRARAEGDTNVYFIDGASFFAGDEFDAHMVDGCHPNDLGFYKMAKGIYPLLHKLLVPSYSGWYTGK